MALTTCKNCGQQISDKAKFCIHCGTPVQKTYLNCPRCNAEVSDTMNFCPECGAKIEINNSTSGSEITESKRDGSPSSKAKNPKWIITAVSVGALLLVGIALFVGLHGQEGSGIDALSPVSKETNEINTSSSGGSIEDDTVDVSTGCFDMDLEQLSSWIDIRLAMLDTDLGAGVTKSNVQKIGGSNKIIAIGEVKDGIISNERSGIVYGINSKGDRSDGIDKHDIKKIHAVIYTNDPTSVMGIPFSIILVCEESLISISEEAREGLALAYTSVVVDQGDPYRFKANGISYELSRDQLGHYIFEAFSDG